MSLNIINLNLLFIVFFIGVPSKAQQKDTFSFPEPYFGIYKGTLNIKAVNEVSNYPMEFHLLPTDSVGRYVYTLIYGEGEMRQVRGYSLIKTEQGPGSYIIDEHNGILLDATVLNARIYSVFEVQGTLLTTFIAFETDRLIFEITAMQLVDKKLSGGQEAAIPSVISYPVSTIQRAVLFKH